MCWESLLDDEVDEMVVRDGVHLMPVLSRIEGGEDGFGGMY